MKKTVAALALGLLIGSAGTAVAATNDTVQAVFAKFNLVINGAEKQLKTDPLVVDGTSYLPVREVAGILGYEVGFDEATGTIKLDNGAKAQEGEAKTNGVDKVNFKAEDWLSLSDLADKHNYKITLSDKLTLKIDNSSFEIPYPTLKDGIVQEVKSDYGTIRFLQYDFKTHLSVVDLKAAKIID